MAPRKVPEPRNTTISVPFNASELYVLDHAILIGDTPRARFCREAILAAARSLIASAKVETAPLSRPAAVALTPIEPPIVAGTRPGRFPFNS